MAGILDDSPIGALDPRAMALMQMGFGLMGSSGSTMPISLGKAIGQAGMQGLSAGMSVAEANRKNAQTQALIDLEKVKTAQGALAANVQLEQVNIQRAALGLPPLAMPGGLQMPSFAAGSNAPQNPVQVASASPSLGGTGPVFGSAPTAGGSLFETINRLPPEFQQAARADVAFNKGGKLGDLIVKANEPLIGREGGIYDRDPSAPGGMRLNPGWLEGERARQQLRQQLENENTIVTEPTGVGEQKRTMTKAQQLRMASGQMLPPQSAADSQTFVPDEESALKFIRTQAVQGKTASATIDAPAGYVTGKTPQQAATETAMQEGARKDADTVSTYRQKLPSLSSSMVSLAHLQNLNADDKTYASSGAELKKNLDRIAQAFGFNINPEIASNTELYIARLGELLKERLASKDYGSGAGVSNLDLATAGVPLPEVAKTREGRQKILDGIRGDILRSYEDMRGAVDYYEGAGKNSLTGFRFPSESVLRQETKPEAPKAESPKQYPTPPQAAIARLKMKPAEREQFDAVFGPGASAKVLGK